MDGSNRQTRPANWSDDELVVLAVIFLNAEFSIGDDARAECRTIADSFGRSAAAVDRQWRNMDSILKGKTGLNVGALVRETIRKVVHNPAGYRSLALRICNERGWPLDDLVRDGRQSSTYQPTEVGLDPELLESLQSACERVEFKVFPSGAQGFVVESELAIRDSLFDLKISAVALATGTSNPVSIMTPISEIQRTLTTVVGSVRVLRYASGRLGIAERKFESVDGIRYDISIHAQQKGNRS